MNRTIENYELPVAALAAAVTHAAKKDIRFYLNGVYLDFPAGRIVATDGHRLFVGAIPAADCAPVIVDRDTVADAVKAAKRAKYIVNMHVNVTEDPNGGTVRRVELVTAGARLSGAEIDWKYPDYGRIIPRKPSGEVGQYNPEYLLDANDALCLYSGIKPGKAFAKVQHNGTSGALITREGTTALCVVMPVRTFDGDADISWFDAAPALAVTA